VISAKVVACTKLQARNVVLWQRWRSISRSLTQHAWLSGRNQEENQMRLTLAGMMTLLLAKTVCTKKMRHLSKSAQLSKVYTNHCLRATCITALDQHGYEARHIMTVSGQKSEASIRAYSRNVTDTKKREMSLTLSSHTAVLPVQNLLSSPTRNRQSVTTTLCLSQEQSSATHVGSANQPVSATQTAATSQRSVTTTIHLSQEHSSNIPFDSQPLLSSSEFDELLEVQQPGPHQQQQQQQQNDFSQIIQPKYQPRFMLTNCIVHIHEK
jgi:hypothetical protein